MPTEGISANHKFIIMSNYRFFIGIDVSKEWIDTAFSIDAKPAYLGRFDNNPDGFRKMLGELKRKTRIGKGEWLVCFENTGQYSKDLLSFLHAGKIPRREEDPGLMSLHLGLTRGKDDKSDVIGICRYAYRHRDELEVSEPVDEKCSRIRRLLARRDLLVKQRTIIRNDLNENKKGFSQTELAIMEDSTVELVAMYDRQIREIELLIKTAISEDEEMKRNDKLIRSVKGVGPVISAYVIALTHNFRRFDKNARKFACYCGIAPFPNESGKFKGRRHVSHRANKRMKALLSNAATSAIVHDSQTKGYYDRKIGEGKTYGNVINAVKNKIVARIFAVVRRQTPYVDTFA
jgi:transposase